MEALVIALSAGALFGGGYYTRVQHEKAQERDKLAAVRARDAGEVRVIMGVEKALQKETAALNQTANTVALAITFIQPVAKEQPGAKPTAVCSTDPYLSLDAVKLLNAARTGTAADAQRILDAARRTPGAAAD